MMRVARFQLNREGAVSSKKVVSLGQVRDLLAEWDRVKAHIVSGKITGFHAAFRDSDMNETMFAGGVYRDPAEAARAALRMSAYRTLTEDKPPRRMTRVT
jgi:uncharacterized protein YbaA (DUF1428 family)